jgi:hypothetical protein
MNIDLCRSGGCTSPQARLRLWPVDYRAAERHPVHKLNGMIYVMAILVTSITALGIYRRGMFFFAHWFAAAALVATAAGVSAAHLKGPRAGWMHLHLTCMLMSFYILVGGGVNEAFLRVNFLRRLIPSLNAAVVGMAHLIAYFNCITLIRLRARRDGVSAMQSAYRYNKS